MKQSHANKLARVSLMFSYEILILPTEGYGISHRVTMGLIQNYIIFKASTILEVKGHAQNNSRLHAGTVKFNSFS